MKHPGNPVFMPVFGMFLFDIDEHRGYKTVGHGIYKLENDVKLVYEIIEERKSYNGGLMNKVMRFKSDEILAEDNKYILKKQGEEDKEAYFNLYQEDSILAKKMPSNMFQDFFDKQWENMKQENSLYVSIFKNPDAVYLGNIILKNLESMTPELGIDILKKYHRKGVAYDTLRMFMKWARSFLYNSSIRNSKKEG